jgi:kynurenine formamidase
VTGIYDLSLDIDEDAPEPFPVRVHRIGHEEGARAVGKKFVYARNDPWFVKLKKLAGYYSGKRRIDRSSFPDGMFLSHESVEASVHCGTHIDSPNHFGPSSEGSPSKTICELPLEWCYGDGVVLDMTSIAPAGEITARDVEASLGAIGYSLKACDIVLMMTGADRYFGSREYFYKFPGVSAEAVEYLLDKGVRVIGTDAASFDRPSGAMVEDYYRTGDGRHLWPAHILGRRREYCHIERLANLGKLPRPYGFKFACFPVKIKNVGAAWTRAVAIFTQ